jgi:hypothetical protein
MTSSSYIRLQDFLLNYYNKLSDGGRIVPKESQLDRAALGENLDNCFLLKIVRPGKYKFQYMGANIIAAYFDELSQEELDSIIEPEVGPVGAKYNEVVAIKKPLFDEGEFIDEYGINVKYRQIAMPLTDEEGNIAYIFGGMRWKKY